MICGLALRLIRQFRPTVLKMVVWLHLYAAFSVLWDLALWLLDPRFLLRHQHHFRHVHLLVQQLRRSSECSMCFDVVRQKRVVDLALVAAQSPIRSA